MARIDFFNEDITVDFSKRTYVLKYQIVLNTLGDGVNPIIVGGDDIIIDSDIGLGNETIEFVDVQSSSDWCVVDVTSITTYQVNLLIDDNISLEDSRESTLTVYVYTNKGVFSAETIITQTAFEINAVWKNKFVRIETQTNSISYHIKHNDNIIYAGKAYVLPNTNYVEIDISKICANYITSTFENTIDSNAMFNKVNGVGTFELYVNNAFYGAYMFYNDYSYSVNIPNTVYNDNLYITLSDPIRNDNIIDSRQYVCYSFFNASESGEIDVEYTFRRRPPGKSQTISATLQGRQQYVVFRKVISNCVSFKILNDIYYIGDTCNKYCLYYLNAYGGWDSFLIDGNDKRTDKITSYKYIKSANNTTRQFGSKKYLNVITPSYTLFSNYLSDEEASKMHHLLESTEVYLHNLEEDEIIPVNITNSSCEYKTFSNNGKKKFYYQIEVEESQQRIRM